jgi:hypothetical protein
VKAFGQRPVASIDGARVAKREVADLDPIRDLALEAHAD